MKRNVQKYVTIAASLVIVFLVGNTVCCAMTGNNLVDEVRQYLDIEKADIRVNNHQFSEAVVSSYIGEDGLTYYEFSDGSTTGIRIDDPEHTSVFEYKKSVEGGSVCEITCFEGNLYQQDGRIYLDLYGEPMDVTEDFADGEVTGSFIYTGIGNDLSERMEYSVKGTLENYTVDVWWVESE